MAASSRGHSHVVSVLLQKESGINLQDKDGYTALMLACMNGHAQIVSLLLDNGAYFSLKDKVWNVLSLPFIFVKTGKTALVWAQENNKSECVIVIENFQVKEF